MESEETQEPETTGGTVAANLLCEFLEVAIHLILYIREIYPAGIFEKRKKYNVPVQMSCHPELNQYIQNVLKTLRPCLEKGEVEKICVVIIDKEFHPLEKFVFEIQIPSEFASLRTDDKYFFHIESALRAFLLKISVCDAMLKPNPPDCRFSLLVYTKQSAVLRVEDEDKTQAFPWMNVEKNETEMKSSSIIPLKSTSSEILKMQLFVEESEKKTT
ncbi:mitotic spindle assembly checkpoint protein MAD2B-like isoform X2 [Dendronephthya gigantea]|uniref:mitotic spindle assembly checkpoint protein MAD2B-like isoform X2 n=1 Tax=Dendronephthya gigantea TaxID=151771 RepID=UPI00106C976B|nr:mitotic spindle assembly checkpoint protein MAD2B-like isoform X2 [Dendronephthya gigantea]